MLCFVVFFVNKMDIGLALVKWFALPRRFFRFLSLSLSLVAVWFWLILRDTVFQACQWNIKNSSESENINWILANTKICPACKVSIEKNQGFVSERGRKETGWRSEMRWLSCHLSFHFAFFYRCFCCPQAGKKIEQVWKSARSCEESKIIIASFALCGSRKGGTCRGMSHDCLLRGPFCFRHDEKRAAVYMRKSVKQLQEQFLR